MTSALKAACTSRVDVTPSTPEKREGDEAEDVEEDDSTAAASHRNSRRPRGPVASTNTKKGGRCEADAEVEGEEAEADDGRL